MNRFLALALFSLLVYCRVNAQEFALTHHSSGEIQQIIINGYGNNLCQLLELVVKLHKNGSENNLVVYIPFPRARLEGIDTACVDHMLSNFVWNSKNSHLAKGNNFTKFDQFDVKSVLKRTSLTKALIESHLKSNHQAFHGEIEVHWFNDIQGLKYPQDAFISFQNRGDFKVEYSFENNRNSASIETLGHRVNRINLIKLQHSELAYDGGNMILSPSLSLIGVDMLPTTSTQDFKDRLEAKLNSESVIYLGNKLSIPKDTLGEILMKQPLYHLDLFMNLIERKDTYVFLLGKVNNLPRNIEEEKMRKYNQRMAEIAKYLCDIDSINNKKVIIDYVPLFFQKNGASWYTYSFNNCLIEYTDGDALNSHIYLPYYSSLNENYQEVFDDLSDTYTKYGFLSSNLHFIADTFGNKITGFDIAVEHKSSLHCFLKVFKRSIPNTSD